MSESSQRKELEAFINFFTAFSLTKDIRTVNDLSDGAALFEVLQIVYVLSQNDMVSDLLYPLEIPITFASPHVRPRSHLTIGFCDSAH